MKNKVKPKPRINKLMATVLTVIVCVALVHAGRWTLGYQKRISSSQAVLARSKGNPKAEYKIIEFIDFQCPACAKGANMLKEYIAQYPTRFYLTMKYYPLVPGHKFAMLSSLYAECAARQNKFWPMHDSLIDRQGLWSQMLNAEPTIREMANKLGLNMEKLDACLSDKDTEAVIMADKSEGKAMGVKSTPTYFVNGTMIVGATSLKNELDQYLGKSVETPDITDPPPVPLHQLQTMAQ